MLIVTIDAGTTNTRVRVWKDSRVISDTSESVGVRDTAITGNRNKLINGVKKALDRALAGISEPYEIVASGMITSDVGLYCVPHLSVPVSFNDLVEGTVAHTIPEVSAQPIWFIPGVKNAVATVDVENIDAMDVMRGEEVETFGLLMQHNVKGPALIVLPGSHSKFILTDEKKQIVSCVTTMAGELLDVLTHQTILANSLDGQFVTKLDNDYLQKGAASCRRVGLARSCFTVRLLDLFTQSTHNQRASYLLGATLYSDLQAIKQSMALNLSPETNIIISGKQVLKEALASLISTDSFFTGSIVQADDDPQRPLSGVGALALMETILCRHTVSQPPFSSVLHQGIPT
ncbi:MULTISPECIES: 2-dehydro-3-deoxygalactonokinase [Citrobacter]|jgi:2-dehydro-3-deoxygalactonokinase|uniref:2-dehydro-3-deoxygalactonokinase n=1 Tax=Citrobacter europaeus TaxID=1914243 RepID=A0ABY0JMF6_9ENTR|nr:MULTISPECIES: 2-dehydro-3-deoxygalactonokinase [Citrobacter]MDM3271969.1 2-dehydro-3-deoxygalactonokinase [Citrobacter sp. Ce129]SBW24366.1 2-dehydro-3-deoxygalactonokinase [Citrobacter europaeus]